MTTKPRQKATRFKKNPKTIKYILKNAEIVERALKQADIIFPTSKLYSDRTEEYYTFKERSFWALDRLIKELEPSFDESLINQIIVETQFAVERLVAIREKGYDAEIDRFKVVNNLIGTMAANLTSTMELMKQISNDHLLLNTVANTMNRFQRDVDRLFQEAASKFPSLPFDIFDFVPDTKNFVYIALTLEQISMPLLRLKEDLADSKLIRSAAEYRCASLLAWIWWERVGREPTTTRNAEARADGIAPKTAFQSFVDEAVPPPRLSEGIMRKVYDDLRLITNIGITENDARLLLLRARSDAKARKGIEDARSLLILARAALGERRGPKSTIRNPQA